MFLSGVYLRKGDEGDTMFCLGFISRRAEDLAPLTRVIAGDKAHLLNLDKDVNVKVNYYGTVNCSSTESMM